MTDCDYRCSSRTLYHSSDCDYAGNDSKYDLSWSCHGSISGYKEKSDTIYSSDSGGCYDSYSICGNERKFRNISWK